MLGLSHNLTKTVCMYNNNYNVQWTLFNLIYKTLSENWLHQSATLSQKKWKQGMIQIRDLSEWAPCDKIIFSYLAVSNWPNSVSFFLLTKFSWDRSKRRGGRGSYQRSGVRSAALCHCVSTVPTVSTVSLCVNWTVIFKPPSTVVVRRDIDTGPFCSSLHLTIPAVIVFPSVCLSSCFFLFNADIALNTTISV